LQLRCRTALAVSVICALGGAAAPAASAAGRVGPAIGAQSWSPCGDAAGVQCATVRVPLDYDRPQGRTISLHVARSAATDPAHRIGSLFFNFGGPGGTAAAALEARGAGLFPGLGDRFDIVAMDPRGVGQSEPSIDCRADQERFGIYSQPFATPANLDFLGLVAKDQRYIRRCLELNSRAILAHVSTANVARDMDLLRQGLGERTLTYLGYSYGTLLGATYASLFPGRYRKMVLDGPLDATGYINDPLATLSAQSSGFERALGRFLQACAADQAACRGFGGSDPWDAYDELLDRLDHSPLPATGYPPDPRPVDGDDARGGTAVALYNKASWPFLAEALAAA
jgi:pimeloyl-ACP methyl ester carboxylesterase